MPSIMQPVVTDVLRSMVDALSSCAKMADVIEMLYED